jgi:signal transduction histidine kinase
MKKRLSTYWWCQLVGWSSYLVLWIFFYFTIRTKPSPHYFESIFLDAFVGIAITHVMRLWIIKANLLNNDLKKQIVYMVLTTIFFSFIYSVIITWTDQQLKWEANEMSQYSFTNKVLRVAFGYFLFLLIWNFIYFTYHFIEKSRSQLIEKIRLENELKLQQLESEKTKAELEQQKAEMETQKFCAQMNQMLKLQQVRLQIASDLHDDMGSTLTSISYYSELVKMHLKEDNALLKPILDKIGNNARNIVNAMSDIVWVINPKNDNTSDLISRMKFNAAEMLGEKNIQYAFKTNDDIEKLKLSMEYRKNLYLIYKEAMNNAVKYSQCSKVEIDFVQSDRQLSLHINDNGKGFDIQNVNEGNGLINMKRRAEEINAHFEICSAQNKGTHIRLTCKIT